MILIAEHLIYLQDVYFLVVFSLMESMAVLNVFKVVRASKLLVAQMFGLIHSTKMILAALLEKIQVLKIQPWKLIIKTTKKLVLSTLHGCMG